MYADDLQVHIHCPLVELDSFATYMSKNADGIWATQYNLRFNVSKTKAMIVGTSYYVNLLSSVARSSMDIGVNPVVYESSLRSLRVVLDSKLSWNVHVFTTLEKALIFVCVSI